MLNNPDQPKHGLFGSLWRKLRNVFVFFFDRLLDGSEKGKPKQRSDYVGNAEWALSLIHI